MTLWRWLLAGAVSSPFVLGAAAISTTDTPLYPILSHSPISLLKGLSLHLLGEQLSYFDRVKAVVATEAGVGARRKAPEDLASARISIKALGSIQVGMTVKEASEASGVALVPAAGAATQKACGYYEPADGPNGIGFMVVDERIIRIDIWPSSDIKTISGVGIGSSKAEIEAVYPGRIETSPDPYTKGDYLTFVPETPGESLYRIVFETNVEGKVVQFRAGQFPAVTWVNGCS